MTDVRKVPTLSLSDLHSDARQDFIKALYDSLSDYGFVVIKDHGIDTKTLQHAYSVAQDFFRLPLDIKQQYEGQGERGYMSFGREKAKDNPHPDLKEYWHVGPELTADSPYKDSYPSNQWPQELPQFKPCFLGLYEALLDLARQLLAALGEAMDLDANYFVDLINDGNTVQRLIHYPPLEGLEVKDSIRAAAHADINLMTLLVGATDSGLQLLDRDGTWLAVENQEGEIVVDTGDMMALLTNDRLPATVHRVINPEVSNTARYSIPFFVHPHNNALLEPLPQFVEDNNRHFEPITAGDYLHQRLIENGLIEDDRN